MIREKWKPIPEWEVYEVSSLGRVRRRGRILKTDKCGWGEKRNMLDMCDAPRRKKEHISRLVLKAFIGPPPFPKAEARHLNDIKTDDRLKNLAWGTHKQNMEDGVRNEVYNPSRRLTVEQVAEVKIWLASIPWPLYGKFQFIGELVGLHKSHVFMIYKDKFWEYVEADKERVRMFLLNRAYVRKYGCSKPGYRGDDLMQALIRNPRKALGLIG